VTSVTTVDLDKALRSVSPDVREAFESAHEALQKKGIAHVLVGGLAVNAYGHRYSTSDVDFLVTQEEAFDGTRVLVHKAGVPYKIAGVPVDYVMSDSAMPLRVQEAMAENLEVARERADKTIVVQDWLLVWMKLNVGRTKDLAAVEGLLRAGLDADAVREELAVTGPARVVELFDRCVKKAEESA
jgi:predicted nucleotidyltransferase